LIKMTTSQARNEFADVLKGVKKGQRFLLERHNKGVAAIVSVQDLALLQAIEDSRDVQAAEAALAEIERTGTVPWDQIKAELGL
jgi:prevent-host-death family protein